jgi:hypothetical protein
MTRRGQRIHFDFCLLDQTGCSTASFRMKAIEDGRIGYELGVSSADMSLNATVAGDS